MLMIRVVIAVPLMHAHLIRLSKLPPHALVGVSHVSTEVQPFVLIEALYPCLSLDSFSCLTIVQLAGRKGRFARITHQKCPYFAEKDSAPE
jgi:hypothetical protein